MSGRSKHAAGDAAPARAGHAPRILWYEAGGFLTIILLSWVNEVTNMAGLIGTRYYTPNARESVLETAIVLFVAVPVMAITRRLLSRLHQLEGYLRVCSWCQKLDCEGEWVPLEEYFGRRFHTETSHGVCEACAEAMLALAGKPGPSP